MEDHIEDNYILDDKYILDEVSKHQIKTSITWLRVLSIIGFIGSAMLLFGCIELINELFLKPRYSIPSEGVLVTAIFVIGFAAVMIISYNLFIASRAFADYSVNEEKQSLERALKKKRVAVITGGVLGILFIVGLFFIWGLIFNDL